MNESIYLMGAEKVSDASASIRNSADVMHRAANNIDGSLDTLNRRMEDWLMRFEAGVERIVNALENPQP